jgi:hypothetical protein
VTSTATAAVAPGLRWLVVCVGEEVALAWETAWVVEEDVVDGLLEVDDELDDVLDVELEDVIDDVIDVDDAVELHVVEGVHVDEGNHWEDQVGLGDEAPKLSVAGELRLKSPV